MTSKDKRCINGLVVSAGLCLVCFSQVLAQGTRGADIAVVVNPETPVTDLSLADVRAVFLGERQYWTAKVPVVLLIRAPAARERDVVLKIIYQMTDTQFKRYWIAKIFRAEAASAPKTVYSSGMTQELVTAIPGAIALIESREVRPPLKVVRVDGHLPGEPGYPLR